MAHVVYKELSLDKELEGREGHHVFNGRNLTLECILVNRQGTVALNAYTQGVVAFHLVGLNRNHTADRGLDKADLLIKKLFLLVIQLFGNGIFKIFVGAYKVFADYYVERSL